jgi:hypothetical protein
MRNQKPQVHEGLVRCAVGLALPKLRKGDALLCRSYAKAMQALLLRRSRLRRRRMARGMPCGYE